MRVSIVNLNWVGADAIGQSIINQVRFFQRRGDEVQVYLVHPARHVPPGVKSVAHVVGLDDLTERRDKHFAGSDLYVYHYPGRYPLLESIKNLERGAVIFYYHNVTPPDMWGSAFEQDVLRDSVAQAGTFANLADLIVTDSPFNAEQLVADYGLERDRIRVLPLAVDLDKFHPGPKDGTLLKRHGLHGKRVILFVGRMAGNKRPDLLVEMLALVRKKVPGATLLLVGDDRGNPAIEETVARAKQRANDLHVAEAVTFTGAVNNLPEYYRLADIYATASLHEGFGVPLSEAMASGVPVVASQATAHPWVLREAGLLTQASDPADMAEKVVQVLTDDVLHGDLVQRGLMRAQDFSLECYDAGWSRILSEATAWLPDRPYPRMRSSQSAAQSGVSNGSAVTPTSPTASEVASSKDVHLTEMETSADIMMRAYTVRSGLPIVGPLVAWIRRNLTSHLREPYLDPTLERQVGFNRRVVQYLGVLTDRLADLEAWRMKQQAQAEDVARQLELLSAQIGRLEILTSGSAERAQLEKLDKRIRELRQNQKDQAAE